MEIIKTIKMKRADAKTWLSALRSGKYKQGSHYMHHEVHDTYCCLGVLQMCVSGKIVYQEDMDELPSYEWLKEHDIEFYNAGFDTCDPYFESVGATATELNDQFKFSFNDIADILERHIEYID